MNCVPDFAKYFGILSIYVFSRLLFQGIKRLDEEIAACDEKKSRFHRVLFSIVVSIAIFSGHQGISLMELISLVLLGVYFVVCSTMDLLLFQVNDFMQYLGLAGGVLYLLEKVPATGIGGSLLFFALLQYGIFIRMYGKADGMAFAICALYFAGRGGEIEVYLLHMLVCFFLLAVVQLCKRNVTLRGKLKAGVALYPYITVSFCLMFP